MGTPTILVEGQKACQLPLTSGNQAAFLTAKGRIICRHGRLRSSLLHMRRHGRRTRCDCTPQGFPHRSSLANLKLGQAGGTPKGQCCNPKRVGEALVELPITS